LQQLLSVWFAIDARKRVIVALSAIAVFVAVLGLSRLATTPTMSLLYAGLEPGTAGEVVQALEQQGVAFDIRSNAIFVDSSRRDQLRMILASEGLPANNGQGYEILDGLSGFGTTAQMFDAAYWRAKEGELARTIVASPQFRAARVHISNTPSQPFRRATAPSASVTVTSAVGALSGANARALKFLISSAVAGMTVADVSVIDGRSGVVVMDDGNTNGVAGGSNRAADLKGNVEQLLEARVGVGNAVVQVFVETNTEREAITERRFDPDSRVAISTQIEERTTSSTNARGGNVTVASNLPDGDGAAGNDSSSSQKTETSEQTNYEVSETTRELLRAPGSIQRISVAVLVNGVLSIDPATSTETWAPRSDEEMSALRQLVESAVGFNADRGDTITLKSMQFQAVENVGIPAQISMLQKFNIDVMRIVQLLVLSVVVLVLGLFVLRPILAATPGPALASASPPPGLPNLSADPAMSTVDIPTMKTAALTGEIDDGGTVPTGLSVVESDSYRTFGSVEQTALPDDPVERLRVMITDRQDETVEILRTWIDGNEERV